MKDELVRCARMAALMSMALWFAGCEGCSGCEGPKPEASPTAASIEALPSSNASATRAAFDAPSASATVAANSEHDPTGVRRCCKIISDNMVAASETHRAIWQKALDACSDAVEKKTGRKGLQTVRDILTPVGWPAACH